MVTKQRQQYLINIHTLSLRRSRIGKFACKGRGECDDVWRSLWNADARVCEALIPLDVIDPREPNTLPLFINTPGYGFKRGLR